MLIAGACVSSANATEIVTKITSVNFDYKETGDSGQTLDTEKASLGKINGIELGIRSSDYISPKSDFVQSFTLSYNSGNTDYKGAYQGGNYGDLTTTTKNKLAKFSYKAGLKLKVADSLAVGANIGVGGRSWRRELNDGNAETYYWSNWILGARADWEAMPKLTLSTTADWQKAANPKMHSSSEGQTFDLGDTNGYKVGISANYKLTNNLSLEGDVVYDYWKINKSNVVDIGGGYVAWEPDSKTKNTYAKLGLVYKF